MDSNDSLYLYSLKHSIFIQMCKIIDKLGSEAFVAEIPPEWFRQNDSYRSLQTTTEVLESLREQNFSLKQLTIILDRLNYKDALALILAEEPAYLHNDLPEELSIKEGETLKLHCRAKGFPFPEFQWYRKEIDDAQYFPIPNATDEILEIPCILRMNAGLYACEAYNATSKGGKKKVYTRICQVTVLINRPNENVDELITIPKVKIQPVSQGGCLEIGTTLELKLVAEGEPPLVYTWYKDGEKMPDSNVSSLRLESLMPENGKKSWKYACIVSNEHGESMSNEVKIQLASPSEHSQYLPRDKIALVIGNWKYNSLHPLMCAEEDATTVAEMLKTLGFKVIALTNLTLIEMKNALDLFVSLLGSRVYGIFYYAGHGFQLNGQCYMLPVNAPNNYRYANTLCVEYVHAEMQKKSPALCGLILDMCRVKPDKNSDVMREKPEIYDPKPDPNSVIAYATTYLSKAYEAKDRKNGIYVSHLRKYLKQDIPFKKVIDKTSRDVNADLIAGNVQYPQVQTNLWTNCRLGDPKMPKSDSNQDNSYDFREKLFTQITTCPPSANFIPSTIQGIAISIEIRPHRFCLLNGLHMIIRVRHNEALQCHIPRLEFQEWVVIQKLDVRPNSTNETVYGVTVLDLQKLKEPLRPQLFLHTTDNEQKTMCPHPVVEMNLNLGFPLIAPAKLWQENSTSNPVEADSWSDSGDGGSFGRRGDSACCSGADDLT